MHENPRRSSCFRALLQLRATGGCQEGTPFSEMPRRAMTTRGEARGSAMAMACCAMRTAAGDGCRAASARASTTAPRGRDATPFPPGPALGGGDVKDLKQPPTSLLARMSAAPALRRAGENGLGSADALPVLHLCVEVERPQVALDAHVPHVHSLPLQSPFHTGFGSQTAHPSLISLISHLPWPPPAHPHPSSSPAPDCSSSHRSRDPAPSPPAAPAPAPSPPWAPAAHPWHSPPTP